MSLIYQALKQNEQQAPATVVAGAPAPAAPPAVAAAAPSAAGWMRRSMLLGVLLLGAGVLAGLLLGQRSGSAPAPAAGPVPAAPVAPPVAVASAEPPPLPKAPVVAVAEPAPAPAAAPSPAPAPAAAPVAAVANPQPVALPKAEPPLPTAGPRLTLSTTLMTQPAPAVTPAPEPKAAPAVAPRPASVEVSVKSGNPAPEPVGTAGMDVAELFDGLNRALDTRDEATATRNIQAIRIRLPESSLARMRAEGWYAFRTGDLEKAQRFYRRLLDKLPGDENASLALASIERQEQRPDQAREVLSKSLKANPGSTVLRSALDQSPNEASR